LFLLLLLATAPAAAQVSVEIVLDMSGSTLVPIGGSSIHARVREAAIAVAIEAGAARPDINLGLRLAGGNRGLPFMDGCSTTGPGIQVGGLDHRWIETLDGVEPNGLRPLITSVLAAIRETDQTAVRRRVVIVTSGDDQCGNTPLQVANALGATDPPVEIRMVGLGLEQTVIDRFAGIPIQNVGNAEELLAAFRWAVLDVEDEPRPRRELQLRLAAPDAGTLEARVRFEDLATGNTHDEAVTGSARLDLPIGRYRLAVEPESGGRWEFRDLLVTADDDAELEIELAPIDPVAIGLQTSSSVAGAKAWIDIAGSVPSGALVLFVDENGLAVTTASDPGSHDGWTETPPRAGNLELVLVKPGVGGLKHVLARQPITVVSGSRGLAAPDDIGIGEDFDVSWSGPMVHGDLVGLVPRDGDPMGVISCAPAGMAAESRLTAPMSESELDVIYVDGATLTVAARHPVRVGAVQATVEGPLQVSVGGRIELAWSGPENAEDFLTLAITGTPDDAYVEWAGIEDGNPAVFEAPLVPGEYELRYIDGETSQASARAPIEITAIPIEIRAPATTRAGLRFEVVWTGPAAHGDFLAISKPVSRPGRYLDWASTTVGSPITLAAPPKPGTYEVRYIANGGEEILVRTTIEVLP